MKKIIDSNSLQEKLEGLYKDKDLSKDDDTEILRRERHSLLVKGLPRPDNAIRVNQPEIKAKISATVSELYQDPNGPYFEHHIGRPSMDRTNLGNNIKDLEKHRETCREAINRKRAEDPTSMRNGGATQAKPCQSPDGTLYSSTGKARNATGINVRTIRRWCEEELNGWKYIQKENNNE